MLFCTDDNKTQLINQVKIMLVAQIPPYRISFLQRAYVSHISNDTPDKEPLNDHLKYCGFGCRGQGGQSSKRLLSRLA